MTPPEAHDADLLAKDDDEIVFTAGDQTWITSADPLPSSSDEEARLQLPGFPLTEGRPHWSHQARGGGSELVSGRA
jgi:hypothetical protein